MITHEPNSSSDELSVQQRSRPLGRRRRFDTDEALDVAVHVFWRKGYSATSIDDLVVATGVSRPSLYLAFGNKERMYIQAVARFQNWLGHEVARCLDLEEGKIDVLSCVGRYLDFLLTIFIGNGSGPKGDLITVSSIAATSEHDAIRQMLMNSIKEAELTLKAFFERAVSLNLISSEVDPQVLSDLLNGLVLNLQQRARTGENHEDLTHRARRSASVLLALASKQPSKSSALADSIHPAAPLLESLS